MNKLTKLVFAATALVAVSSVAFADDIKANTPYSAYVQDGRGVIARDAFGLCWRTGYWTPADAVPGCDGGIAKVETPTMPPVTPQSPSMPPVIAQPGSIKVKFAADAFFDFNKAVLKPEGKAKLNELVANIKAMKSVEVIIATGHTDSIGSDAYNQKLSVRRAEAVKAYVVSEGIEANRVYTEGKGKTQPVASNKTAAGRAENRRVEIEVVGTKNQ